MYARKLVFGIRSANEIILGRKGCVGFFWGVFLWKGLEKDSVIGFWISF
jgi:hypothetical protein